MTPVRHIAQSDEARVLVISQRLLSNWMSRCLLYQFEDLISELDAADIVAPERSLAEPAWRRKLRSVMTRSAGRRPVNEGRGLRHVDRTYDMLFASCENLSDLLELGPLDRWLRSARTSVCLVEEVWAADLPKRTGELELLGRFDRIFASCWNSVAPLEELTGKPCTYLPPAVDALEFCPFPQRPERFIDIYNMGRRSPAAHVSLKALARERDFFYVFDTTSGGYVEPREHRSLLAQLVKRCRYFVVNRAKFDCPESIQGQVEIGSRYFEGVAGGAVLIGDAPDCPTFEQFFGWPDAVVAAEPTGVADTIEALESDPARVAGIQAANVKHSLLRHDWVYHWSSVLDSVGLPPTPAMDSRRQALADLAATIETPAGQDLTTPS